MLLKELRAFFNNKGRMDLKAWVLLKKPFSSTLKDIYLYSNIDTR